MSRSRNNSKKKKTTRRISKRRLIVLIVGMLLSSIVVFKGVQVIVSVVGNIISQFQVDTNGGVSIDGQFDLSTEVDKSLDSEFTIMIDAGHGGNDTGAITPDGNVYEKDIAIEIAKDIAMKLSTQKDVQVIVSRKDDTYISLSDRAKLANEQEVDLFVSIHINSMENNYEVNGFETYYTEGSLDGSKELAEHIQESAVAYVETRDRGAKEARFQVLLECEMPSVLVEAGFLSNAEELKNLQDEEYQEQLAEGISQGILSYLDSIK